MYKGDTPTALVFDMMVRLSEVTSGEIDEADWRVIDEVRRERARLAPKEIRYKV